MTPLAFSRDPLVARIIHPRDWDSLFDFWSYSEDLAPDEELVRAVPSLAREFPAFVMGDFIRAFKRPKPNSSKVKRLKVEIKRMKALINKSPLLFRLNDKFKEVEVFELRHFLARRSIEIVGEKEFKNRLLAVLSGVAKTKGVAREEVFKMVALIEYPFNHEEMMPAVAKAVQRADKKFGKKVAAWLRGDKSV